MIIAAWFAGMAIALAVLYLICRRIDPRMLRNALFLTGAIVLGIVAVTIACATVFPVVAAIVRIAVLLLPVLIAVVGITFIVNGIIMIRAEGRSVANRLSLIVGLLIIVVPAAAIAAETLLTGPDAGIAHFIGLAIVALACLISIHLTIAFVSFAIYSVVYGRMRHSAHPAAIIVLGSGLIDGRVPPLLRARLDRAIQAYRMASAGGVPPVLIPSGGQGHDEPRPEGTAMAEYLIGQGIPKADVLPETAARNTHENLLLSRRLQEESGRTGPILIATNDYHVLRSATLARKLDLDAQVIGARTAKYYVPSAFIREFIAIISAHRWLNFIACCPSIVFVAFLTWASLQQTY